MSKNRYFFGQQIFSQLLSFIDRNSFKGLLISINQIVTIKSLTPGIIW
jgi:hypothetical protein